MLVRMAKEEVWLERVLAWRASGRSAVKFCEGTSCKPAALCAWSSRLGQQGKVPRAMLGPQLEAVDSPARAEFARVVTQRADDSGADPVVSETGSLVLSIGQSRIEENTEQREPCCRSLGS
jgi:hypothetical protein